MKRIAICAFAILNITPCDSEETTDIGISYRGIPLGISLSEFRSRPSPDSGGIPVKVVCRGDRAESLISSPSMELPISESYSMIGVVACGYFRSASAGPGLWSWPPEFAGTSRYITTFYFTPGNDKRLFKVSINSDNKIYDIVINAITTKYGAPKSSTENSIQNGIGNVFVNITTAWAVGGCAITVNKYNLRTNFMLTEFTKDAIAQAVDTSAKKWIDNKRAGGL